MKNVMARSVAALAVLGACFLQSSIHPLAAQTQRRADYRISGPYVHDNLTIFLIHGPNQAAGNLLTLDEAIDQHKVRVYETRNVNELAVENISNEDVFLESGDIVKGGAQDRTLKDDLILPSNSGKVAISSFCVEHGRWSRRGNESLATFGEAHQAIASKQLKMAVKVRSDQGAVWDQVAQAQARLSGSLARDVRAAASPTSFAMTMENPAVVRSIDGYLQQLAGIINGKNDVIGYAFAIDGQMNSADLYASHDLLAKLWMKLLRASAVEAVAVYRPGRKFAPVSLQAAEEMLAIPANTSEVRMLNARTQVVVKETTREVLFETRDRAQRDAWIHRNYLTK